MSVITAKLGSKSFCPKAARIFFSFFFVLVLLVLLVMHFSGVLGGDLRTFMEMHVTWHNQALALAAATCEMLIIIGPLIGWLLLRERRGFGCGESVNVYWRRA
jgi:hypothetical protein